MSTDLTTSATGLEREMLPVVVPPTIRPDAAAQADQAAARALFDLEAQGLDADTLRRHEGDLTLFARFLLITASIYIEDAERELLTAPEGLDALAKEYGNRFFHEPAAWSHISWGLVKAFVQWQLSEGYAISSVNARLSAVRRYARLAMQAGAISTEAYALISAVQGKGGKAARNIDRERETTRIGLKKVQAVRLTGEQIYRLKQQPNTPQGRRDALLMCLLLDLGLRAGEVAALAVEHVNLNTRTITVYREKVDITQQHELKGDVLVAVRRYLEHDRAGAAPDEPLLLATTKRGELAPWWRVASKDDSKPDTFGTRAIGYRVKTLGAAVGAPTLSPHDCRHNWATDAAQNKTSPAALRDAGGWSNFDTPNIYVEQGTIANAGVDLTRRGSDLSVLPALDRA